MAMGVLIHGRRKAVSSNDGLKQRERESEEREE